MKRVILFLPVLAFLLMGCPKSKYPEPITEGDPVFYFSGLINGSETYLKAGINDYYMYSSLEQDSNNVYNLIGNLKPISCSKCLQGSIRFQVNSQRAMGHGQALVMDSVLSAKTYSLYNGVKFPSYSVSFSSTFNRGNPVNPKWIFGDNTNQVTGTDLVHIFGAAGQYNVCYSAGSNNNCNSSLCNTIKVGPNSLTTSVSQATTAGGLNNIISFTHKTGGGKPPYQLLWSFGDGTTDVVDNPVHIFPYQGSYAVSLRVTDANNETATWNFNAVTKTDQSSCAANYEIASMSELPFNKLALSTFIVTWEDPSGVVYTSASPLQPSSSTFRVMSVEDFDRNESGQLTKKIQVRFNCNVYNGTNYVVIENAEAVISVAYQ